MKPEMLRIAACRGLDGDLFYPERGEAPATAMSVCSSCPVRATGNVHQMRGMPARMWDNGGTTTTVDRARLQPPRSWPEPLGGSDMTDTTTRPLPDSFRYDVDPESGCWVWAAYCDSNGYARIYDRFNAKTVWAHRYSYEHHKAPIPSDHEIDHVCQNTACVNPEHLDAVTSGEHSRRTMERLGKDDLHAAAARLRRSRMTYGEIADALGYASRTSAQCAVHSAVAKGLIDSDDVPPVPRLTPGEIEDAQALRAMGVPVGVIADLYGIHESQASRVSRGITRGWSS